MHNKEGSLFFVLMIACMIISSTLYALFRSTSYLITIAREREMGEKQYYLAHFLEMYGKQLYNAYHKKTVFTDKLPLFKGALPGKNNAYKGHVWVEMQKDAKSLYVEIKKNNKVVTILSSLL